MQESQIQFIKRQILQLHDQQMPPKEILIKSLSILDDDSIVDKALHLFEKTGSLIITLAQLGVIQIDNKLLDIINKQNPPDNKNQIALISLLEIDTGMSSIFQFLKVRISAGLAYALWLSLIATSVFGIIKIYVFPTFSTTFAEFGGELPKLTRIAIKWQESLFSPLLIGSLIVLGLTFILIATKISSKNNIERSFLKFIPILKNVLVLVNNINWLNDVRILSLSGLSLGQILKEYSRQPDALDKHSPLLMQELVVAEKIDTLNSELNFQIQQLQQLGEKTVINSVRILSTLVMILTVSYIIFALIASYLPIFQMGSII